MWKPAYCGPCPGSRFLRVHLKQPRGWVAPTPHMPTSPASGGQCASRTASSSLMCWRKEFASVPAPRESLLGGLRAQGAVIPHPWGRLSPPTNHSALPSWFLLRASQHSREGEETFLQPRRCRASMSRPGPWQGSAPNLIW